MFRILQGDVGSGKTIVALISALNVIESGYQVALMVPTGILVNQHYLLAKKIFPKNIKINLITSKTDLKTKKEIQENVKNCKLDILFGTHSLFQKNMNFGKLGYIIIDEQHKFGVKQRKALSDKGGINCDVLLMSATPIPRTLTMTIYGDMDLSIIKEKPTTRKDVTTYSKIESKINDVINFVKKEIQKNNQIFFVGNSMIDSLVRFEEFFDGQTILMKYNIQQGDFILVTTHRPSNVDDIQQFNDFIEALNQISERYPVILPVHPRTKKMINENNISLRQRNNYYESCWIS